MAFAKQVIFASLLAIATFLISNHLFQGNLRDVDSLRKELQTPQGDLSQWKLGDPAPFKYRVLFKSTVNSIYSLLGSKGESQFYTIYYGISLSLYIALFNVVLYFFTFNGISRRTSWVGLILFAISPPILFAYTLPIHTREDILAYLLLFLGLLAIDKKKNLGFILILILGILTRETLLILSLAFLFRSKFSSTSIGVLIASLIGLGILRYALGIESYDIWLGLRWNLQNPVIAIGFIFMCFHALWLPFLIQLKKPIINESTVAVGAIISTTVLFGIANEIRLIFLAVPWVMLPILNQLDTNWDSFIDKLKGRKFFLLSGSFLIIFVFASVFSLDILNNTNIDNRYNIPLNLWLIAGFIYAYLSIISLPLLPIFRRKNGQ